MTLQTPTKLKLRIGRFPQNWSEFKNPSFMVRVDFRDKIANADPNTIISYSMILIRKEYELALEMLTDRELCPLYINHSELSFIAKLVLQHGTFKQAPDHFPYEGDFGTGLRFGSLQDALYFENE